MWEEGWRRVSVLLGPAVLFVCAYSLLPHKELRFIFHAIPAFNTVAALGLSRLYRRATAKKSAALPKLLCLGAIGLVAVSGALSAGFLLVSSKNYPGGEAMALLHGVEETVEQQRRGHRVHIGVEAAMSGVTRFTQESDGIWEYSKEEIALTSETTGEDFAAAGYALYLTGSDH